MMTVLFIMSTQVALLSCLVSVSLPAAMIVYIKLHCTELPSACCGKQNSDEIESCRIDSDESKSDLSEKIEVCGNAW